MARKITLQKILAYDATNDARNLIKEYGLSAKNHQDLENKLGILIREKNVDALKKMAEIHPDKIIFEMLETKSNACGCSGIDGSEEKSNCSGGCSCGKKEETKSNACGCSSAKTSGFNGGSGDGLDLGGNYGGRNYRYSNDNTNTYVILAVALTAIFIAVKKHI